MAEEKTNGKEQQNEEMSLFGKAKKGIVTGVKFIGKVVSGTVVTVKNNVKETLNERELHDKISEQFNLTALPFTMVIPEENQKLVKLFAQVDSDKKTLTFLGDVAHLTPYVYFVDDAYCKLEINLIRVRQPIDITIDNVVYPRTVTVIEYSMSNDDETKKQMQAIVNNN